MPTYVCAVPAGLLSDDQKARFAQAISHIHADATGSAGYLVQVVIDESAKTRFLGGNRVDDQIWIRGDIRIGRPETLRTAMICKMARELALIAQVKESQIWLYLCNLQPTDMIEYGQVLPSLGQEKIWFDGLPEDLKARLSGLEAHQD
jgi:phenylpyruvate tautomerase PptA (4-oxalocrotonate tautomerase family)